MLLQKSPPSRVIVFIALFLASPLLAACQTACNGYSEYCSKTYSNVTYVAAHNSYAIVGEGSCAFLFVFFFVTAHLLRAHDLVQLVSQAANQNYNVTVQLDNGVRMLQVRPSWSFFRFPSPFLLLLEDRIKSF
jgi:hypothetical protein